MCNHLSKAQNFRCNHDSTGLDRKRHVEQIVVRARTPFRDWKLARTSWGAWRVPSISPQGYLFCFLHKNERLYGTENSWGNRWEPIKSVDDDIMFLESVNLDYFIIFVDSRLKCVLSNGYLNLVWPTQFSYRQNKPVAKRPNTCLSPHNNHFPI